MSCENCKTGVHDSCCPDGCAEKMKLADVMQRRVENEKVVIIGENLAAHLKPSLEAAGHEVDVVKQIDEDLRSQERSEREERPLTMDEARAQVCRTLAEVLEGSIAATTDELKKAVEAKQTGPAEVTGARIVTAAQELRQQLLATARKLDRPRILRPERGLKVVR